MTVRVSRARAASFALALAVAVPTAAFAGLLQSLIDSLPEQSPGSFSQNLPEWIAEAKARPDANPGTFNPGSVLIAPVVFGWAPEPPAAGRGFEPWWIVGDKTAGVQSVVNETHRKIVDAFRSRGWAFTTPAWLREQGAALENIGSKPIGQRGRAYGGGDIAVYSYVSDKLKQWDTGDFARLKGQHPSLQTVALVRFNSIWTYKGHSRVNSEAMVSYDVFTTFDISLCDSTSCKTARNGPDNALKAILAVPADKAGDDKRRASNNDFAIGLASDYFSGVAIAIIENLLGAAPPAPVNFEAGGTALGAELRAPASLKVGEHLASANGRYTLGMQSDGNLVLAQNGEVLWSSGSAGKGASIATMQEDGNLVLYKGDGTPIWSSNTWKSGASRAVMQDDGNFVLYKPDGTPVWASGTNR